MLKNVLIAFIFTSFKYTLLLFLYNHAKWEEADNN